MIGYEYEFIVREGDRPLSKGVFKKFHQRLQNNGWKSKIDKGTNKIVGSSRDGIIVTTDDSIQVMEVNFTPTETVGQSDSQFKKIVIELQEVYKSLGASIVGTSVFPGFFEVVEDPAEEVFINPYTADKNYMAVVGRRTPTSHQKIYNIAAFQVWLDVEKVSVLEQLMVINRLSPILLALFANGPIYKDSLLPGLEGRDILWIENISNSKFPYDKKIYGMPNHENESIIDYFKFVLEMPFYFGERDGITFDLQNKKMTHLDYFKSKRVEGVRYDKKKFTVEPRVQDFELAQKYTFPCARLKFKLREDVSLKDVIHAYESGLDKSLLDMFKKTYIECRCVSAQPQEFASVTPAFLLGLQQKINEVEEIVNTKPYSFWKGLYQDASKHGLKSEILCELSEQMLDIATQGLIERGQSEEKYIEPLKERVKKRKNPAQELVEIWEQKGLAGIWQDRDYKIE